MSCRIACTVSVSMNSCHSSKTALLRKYEANRLVRPSRSKRCSRCEFVRDFCLAGCYSRDEVTELILSAESVNGLFVEVRPSTLSIRCNIEDKIGTLMTFAVLNGSCPVIFTRPESLSREILLGGHFPTEAEDFFSLFKKCSINRSDSVIYADVQKVLDRKRDFYNCFKEVARLLSGR